MASQSKVFVLHLRCWKSLQNFALSSSLSVCIRVVFSFTFTCFLSFHYCRAYANVAGKVVLSNNYSNLIKFNCIVANQRLISIYSLPPFRAGSNVLLNPIGTVAVKLGDQELLCYAPKRPQTERWREKDTMYGWLGYIMYRYVIGFAPQNVPFPSPILLRHMWGR